MDWNLNWSLIIYNLSQAMVYSAILYYWLATSELRTPYKFDSSAHPNEVEIACSNQLVGCVYAMGCLIALAIMVVSR